MKIIDRWSKGKTGRRWFNYVKRSREERGKYAWKLAEVEHKELSARSKESSASSAVPFAPEPHRHVATPRCPPFDQLATTSHMLLLASSRQLRGFPLDRLSRFSELRVASGFAVRAITGASIGLRDWERIPNLVHAFLSPSPSSLSIFLYPSPCFSISVAPSFGPSLSFGYGQQVWIYGTIKSAVRSARVFPSCSHERSPLFPTSESSLVSPTDTFRLLCHQRTPRRRLSNSHKTVSRGRPADLCASLLSFAVRDPFAPRRVFLPKHGAREMRPKVARWQWSSFGREKFRLRKTKNLHSVEAAAFQLGNYRRPSSFKLVKSWRFRRRHRKKLKVAIKKDDDRAIPLT